MQQTRAQWSLPMPVNTGITQRFTRLWYVEKWFDNNKMQGSADPADPADHRSSIWRSPDKNPSKTPQLVKEMPLKTHACEGYSNLSKTEGFLRNFHWIIQHCLPDTLHHRRRKGHVVCTKLSKGVNRVKLARDICQAAEENRTYNEAYQRLQQEVENSEEPKTSQSHEGEPKLWALIFSSRKWKKHDLFLCFFPEMCYRSVDKAIWAA